MRQQTKSERILQIHSFNGDQIPRNFRGALAESHSVIVHGELLWIVCQRSETFRLEAAQMFHSHLKNFRFLQFSRSLLLEGGGNETAKLVEAIVDAVATFLLDRL